jgi:GNAT superfamily N-acetyltransferase
MPDPLTDHLRLRPGSLRDYALLARHHYRGGKPSAATRVLVFEDPTPCVVSRFTGQRRAKPVVAVLVETLPLLGCALRQQAWGERYTTGLTRRQRAQLLNAEVRCISRVVVAPEWRGLGLAVRLVRHALDTATTPITEARAAMGRVSPFFERAGMTAYRRPPHRHDARLRDALRCAGDNPPPDDPFVTRELQRWARAAHVDPQLDPTRLRAIAEARLMFAPVYYAHRNLRRLRLRAPDR